MEQERGKRDHWYKSAAVVFLWAVIRVGLVFSFLLMGQLLGGYLWSSLFLALVAVIAIKLKRLSMRLAAAVCVASIVLAMAWFFTLEPRNDRNWVLDTSVLPRIAMSDSKIEIANMRDFRWRSEEIVRAHWKDESYDLRELNGLELIVEPFGDSELTAHVMLGFRFSNSRRLVVSVEARREVGEQYALLAGAARQFELIYVFASEADIIDLRAVQRGNRVYAFPLKVEVEFMRRLLLELCESANSLHDAPRFYATLRDNCATTLLKNSEKVAPANLGFRFEILFPAKLGNMVYELGWIDNDRPLEETLESFRITGPRVEGEFLLNNKL